MGDYMKKMMLEKVKELKRSMMNEFPPPYTYDITDFNNCYSYAFGIRAMSKNFRIWFNPGAISKCVLGKDVVVLDSPFCELYEIEEMQKSVISDAEILERNAIVTGIDSPYTVQNAYKIFLCKCEEYGYWHFIREAVTPNGEKLLAHKQSFKNPTGIVTRKGDKLYYGTDEYTILTTFELSEKK